MLFFIVLLFEINSLYLFTACGVTNSEGRKSRKDMIGYNRDIEIEEESEEKSEYFIVGGKEATPGSWPWIVQIMFKSSSAKNHTYICCGSIINDQYVLSAAHCVLSLNPNDFRIKIGATKLKSDGEVVEVEKIIVHEAYTSLRHQNDLSLFKLKQRINWNNNKNLAPVCIPTPDMASMDLTGQLTWLIGWGTTSSGGKVSQDLLEVQVPIITNPKCATAYDSIFSGPDRISERQLCAGYDEGGKDSCQGDSGGPLMMRIKGRVYQLGIVSYGNGCARAGYPGVYTKVAWFSYWIGYQIAKESRLYSQEGEE
jgi:secreted trypsin-like serine protease